MRKPRKIIAPRICFDMLPPNDQLEYFAGLAKVEDPTNVIVGLDQLAGISPVQIAFITAKKWANGRTLNVAFMGGTSSQKNHVRTVVPELENYCSIRFKFDVDPGQSDIRVNFIASEGAYSYVGTDCLGIPKNTHTLNLGWIDRGTTLHEFLHALGAIHEHQHPESNIPWNKAEVYRQYAGAPNFWDKAKVDQNVFGKYSVGITQFSAYDRTSVMHYPIDRSLVLDPAYAVGWNKELSANDKIYLGTIYPKVAAPPPPVEVRKKWKATLIFDDQFATVDKFEELQS